ncbi:tRNA 2-thiouridine(34) synthase MnmA [bacterium]|nr:tRNA 2-thiouridine(34) synthase MnmA [candidate division CSSED10-310 bacterium]
MNDVIVALSGGVDSAAAAVWCVQHGYSVRGVTLKLIDDPVSRTAIDDARRICDQLRISHEEWDVSDQFWNDVIEPFCRYYRQGITPNPCLRCNPTFKWQLMLDPTRVPKETVLATGHYAGITEYHGRSALRRGKIRDQSYFLHRVSADSLRRTIFPVGDADKRELRDWMARSGIHVSDRPDSQEVCFIRGSYPDFLNRMGGAIPSPGDIYDLDGNRRGRHRGIHHYTVGQRSGLGIAAPYPLYVVRIDSASNRVIIGKKSDVQSRVFWVGSAVWSAIDPPVTEMECTVQVRYRHQPTGCWVEPVGSEPDVRYRVTLFNHEGAVIAPGQGAAFYRNDIVLGGGEILETDRFMK